MTDWILATSIDVGDCLTNFPENRFLVKRERRSR